MSIAMDKKSLEMVKLLMRHKAALDVADGVGDYPIQRALKEVTEGGGHRDEREVVMVTWVCARAMWSGCSSLWIMRLRWMSQIRLGTSPCTMPSRRTQPWPFCSCRRALLSTLWGAGEVAPSTWLCLHPRRR